MMEEMIQTETVLSEEKKSHKHRKPKSTLSDKILITVFYVTSTLFGLMCLYPFVQVLISSFADEKALLAEGYKLVPSKWSLDAYRVLVNANEIWTSYGVTLFITIVGTLLTLFITVMAAYVLSGNKIKYKNFFNFFFYFTMLFNGGLVGSFILISDILHLTNSIWVYILPASFNVWNCFLLRNFFAEVPEALIESGKLDGASDITVLFRIVLPLSLPAIATIGLFSAVAFWNEWGLGLLYITDERLYTLQYQIVRLVQSIDAASNMANSGMGNMGTTFEPPANTLRLATAIITIGPIILLYPFLQKYFVSGLKVGGVKG